MVGDHQIDRSLSQALPQSLAIVAAPNRRRTFAQGRAIADRFRRQMKVVRAALHAHRKSFGAGDSQFRKRVAGREVDDVQTKTVFAAQR